jgi:hypothetical protein
MKKVGDLEGDQRSLAGDGQELAGEVDAEMQKRMQGQLDQLLQRMKDNAEALQKKLSGRPPRELGEMAQDELGRAQEAAKQLKRLLPAKDFGEARRETDRALSSLKRVRRSVDERNSSRRQPSQSMESFAGDMGEAAKLAQELSADLETLSPRSDQAMSPQQRDRGRGLGERQGSLEQRARGLAEEMGRRASQIPGADKAGEEMKSIAGQMGDAGEDLQKGAPREGAGKAQEAAERLAKLRDAMGRRQMGQGQQRREPVRIPGADESKAPREWRQELLDAMREKAPDHFKEEVRKYYEELVK